MSKSLGNVISPDEILKKYGVDILRLWVVASDYYDDLKLDNAILQSQAESYRRIRNTFRFPNWKFRYNFLMRKLLMKVNFQN